jgi:hypothetical protein
LAPNKNTVQKYGIFIYLNRGDSNPDEGVEVKRKQPCAAVFHRNGARLAQPSGADAKADASPRWLQLKNRIAMRFFVIYFYIFH